MNLKRIKKVVVVYGDKETGKTTALCMLCESLIAKCRQGKFVLQQRGDKARLAVSPKNKNGNYQDVLCAVHCKDKTKKDVLVGICTAGDNWESVEQAFMFLDGVFSEDEFACVFIAIRKQGRLDGLGVAEKSFPLMALERKEYDGLLNVIRPFEKAPNRTKLPKVATLAQKKAFNENCRKLARRLKKMI